MEDEEEEESAEDQIESSSQASSSTPSMTLGQWKEKMRRLEAKVPILFLFIIFLQNLNF